MGAIQASEAHGTSEPSQLPEQEPPRVHSNLTDNSDEPRPISHEIHLPDHLPRLPRPISPGINLSVDLLNQSGPMSHGVPINFTRDWFRVRFAELSLKALLVTICVGLALLFVLYDSTKRITLGNFYYYMEYIRSALGDDAFEGVCGRVMQVENPTRQILSQEDWYQYQRCQGNKAGFEQQGELGFSLWGVFQLVEKPLRQSPPLTVAFSFVFFYWIFPSCCHQASRLWTAVLNTEGYTWGKFVCVVAVISAIPVWMYSVFVFALYILVVFGLLAFILFNDSSDFSEMYVATKEAEKNIFVEPIVQFSRWGWAWAWEIWVQINTRSTKENIGSLGCIHVGGCSCFSDSLLKAYQEYKETVKTSHAEMDRLIAENDGFRRDAKTIESDYWRFESAANFCWAKHKTETRTADGVYYSAALPPDAFKDDYEEAQARIMQLEKENDDLILNAKSNKRLFRVQIDNLQAQINYAQGAGEDRTTTKSELGAAYGRMRTLERQLYEASLAEMVSKQALAKERQTVTEGCHSEALCQRKIRELEHKSQTLLDLHKQNEIDVSKAAMLFGLSEEEAEHVSLKSYMTAVTAELVRLKNLSATDGGTSHNDLTVEIFKREIESERNYRSRLEKEVARLGGPKTLVEIRLGLDTNRPDAWKVDELTYDEEACRVFPFYETLCHTVQHLTSIFTSTGLSPPDWDLEQPRPAKIWEFPDDAVRLPIGQINRIGEANNDELVQKLTVGEVQRWFNRGLQLRKALIDTVHTRGEGVTQEGKELLQEEIIQADKVFRDVVYQILDSIGPMYYHDRMKVPLAKVLRKFELYRAFQDSIAAVSLTIVTNRRELPSWLPAPRQTAKPRTTPELLAINLLNHEVRTLRERLIQLLQYMEDERFPGTLSGPPFAKLQNDPDYEVRFQQLVAAKTYSELTISHYNLHKAQHLEVDPENPGKIIVVPSEEAVRLLPLKLNDYMRTCLGINKVPKKRDPREWNDDVTAQLWDYPDRGVRYEFVEQQPNQNNKNKNNKNTNISKAYDNNDNNNSYNTNNNNQKGGKSEFQDEKEKWDHNRERIEQLKSLLVSKGKLNPGAGTKYASQLKKNADVAWLREQNIKLKPILDPLYSQCKQYKIDVPKAPHKGGQRVFTKGGRHNR